MWIIYIIIVICKLLCHSGQFDTKIFSVIEDSRKYTNITMNCCQSLFQHLMGINVKTIFGVRYIGLKRLFSGLLFKKVSNVKMYRATFYSMRCPSFSKHARVPWFYSDWKDATGTSLELILSRYLIGWGIDVFWDNLELFTLYFVLHMVQFLVIIITIMCSSRIISKT